MLERILLKQKSNFYTRAGQLLGSTLLVETYLILQDGVGNQIEKVYQKFEIEPETEESYSRGIMKQ